MRRRGRITGTRYIIAKVDGTNVVIADQETNNENEVAIAVQ